MQHFRHDMKGNENDISNLSCRLGIIYSAGSHEPRNLLYIVYSFLPIQGPKNLAEAKIQSQKTCPVPLYLEEIEKSTAERQGNVGGDGDDVEGGSCSSCIAGCAGGWGCGAA